MAGIKANSVSVTMGDGDTAVDKAVAGYLTSETITLSTTPTGSAYSWGIARPSGSGARANLSSATAAAPVFTPDVAGYYVVTCVVDSTTSYVIRISVTQTAITTSYEAVRLQPKTDASISTPPLGDAVYWSDDLGMLALKDSAGTVRAIGAQLRAYAAASLPSAATAARLIYVSDEVGGATIAFSDGTNWRRVQDRAVVS